jgi:hypothetical protein
MNEIFYNADAYFRAAPKPCSQATPATIRAGLCLGREYTVFHQEEPIVVLELEDAARAIYQAHKDLGGATQGALDLGTLPALLSDVVSTRKLLKDIGFKGKYRIRFYGGKEYVIFSGHAGLRNIIKGTRYLARNNQIVDIGIGSLGMQKALRGNVILTIIAYTSLEIINYAVNDDVILSDVLANILIDTSVAAISMGIGSVLTYSALAMLGAISIPGIAVAGISIVVGMIAGAAISSFINEDLRDTVSDAFTTFGQKSAELTSKAVDNVIEAVELGLVHPMEIIDDASSGLSHRLSEYRRRLQLHSIR